MATKAQPVRIGPFTGGLNTYSDPTAVADEEATDLLNFDVDLDGSLISRPAIRRVTPRNTGRFNMRLLCTYQAPSGTIYYILQAQSFPGGPGTVNYLMAFDPIALTYTSITSGTTVNFQAAVVYMNKVWVFNSPGMAGSGGSWDGTTWTNVAALPKGVTACVYKERLFVGTGELDTTNPSRVFFSSPANPSTWSGTDFFDVSNGDGQAIRKIYSFSGSIVVFKTASTYAYAYESSPTKGQVQSVSASVGIDGLDCMCEIDNVLYVVYNVDVYSITNWSWEQLNIKVPFVATNSLGSLTYQNKSLSQLGNRLVFRYYDTYYVFGVKTRTWTKWTTVLRPDFWMKMPVQANATGADVYYAGNYELPVTGSQTTYLFKFVDGHTAEVVDGETAFDVMLTTKIYSMNVPYSFKRLMWWGVDLLSKTAITVQAQPISYGTPVRWKDLQAPQQAVSKTWADMANNTWGSPLAVSLVVTDSTGISATNTSRMFLKFIKSLRFRQIQFTLSSNTDGLSTKGPVRVYSITAMVINKQLVSKKIS